MEFIFYDIKKDSLYMPRTYTKEEMTLSRFWQAIQLYAER